MNIQKLAREMGFTIVYAPTDCSSGLAGTPARERMAGHRHGHSGRSIPGGQNTQNRAELSHLVLPLAVCNLNALPLHDARALRYRARRR